MEIIIVAILFIGTLAYLYFTQKQRDKVEKERFREFVIANKSKDIFEYVQAVPVEEQIEIKKEDELIDLDQLTPEELLNIKQDELK